MKAANVSAVPTDKPPKIKVLIVDDHPFVRAGVAFWLGSHEQFEVVGQAESGAEAIRQAQERSPDVVLMDLSMPGMDGLEVTKSLRESCPQSRVLILSLHEKKEFVREMIQSGAQGYVRKDTTREDLVSAIERVNRGETFFVPEIAESFFTEYVLNGGKMNDSAAVRLSPRENEVMRGILQGLANNEIAHRMQIRTRTVEKHRQRMMKKLGIHKSTELVKYALTGRSQGEELLKAG